MVAPKWFDKRICPQLERLRQLSIRSHGAFEEAFGNAFVNVSGAFQDALCDRLCPGAREVALAREPPPRGTGTRHPARRWLTLNGGNVTNQTYTTRSQTMAREITMPYEYTIDIETGTRRGGPFISNP